MNDTAPGERVWEVRLLFSLTAYVKCQGDNQGACRCALWWRHRGLLTRQRRGLWGLTPALGTWRRGRLLTALVWEAGKGFSGWTGPLLQMAVTERNHKDSMKDAV